MKRLLMLILLLLPLSLAGTRATAAEEYTNAIPAELARLLLDFYNRGDFAVYDGILDEFPAFDLPPGFTVYGSLRQTGSLRVALRTDLDERAATSALEEEFLDRDWIEMPSFEPFRRETGFVSPENSPMNMVRNSLRLCHDGAGQLSLSYLNRDNENYVMLSASDRGSPFGSDLRTCAEQIEQNEQSMAMRSMRGSQGLAEYMPRMELPAPDDEDFRPIRVGGMSGSNQEMETDAMIQIDWDMEDLYDNLAEQIVAQGWVLDSDSIGEVSATGTWVNSTAATGTYIGTLTIVAANNDRYDLKFVIRAQGRQGGGVFIRGGN